MSNIQGTRERCGSAFLVRHSRFSWDCALYQFDVSSLACRRNLHDGGVATRPADVELEDVQRRYRRITGSYARHRMLTFCVGDDSLRLVASQWRRYWGHREVQGTQSKADSIFISHYTDV